MSKLFLAFFVMYAASHIAFDRLGQRRVIEHQSPAVQGCYFNPIQRYGDVLSMGGYFEQGRCCKTLSAPHVCQHEGVPFRR